MNNIVIGARVILDATEARSTNEIEDILFDAMNHFGIPICNIPEHFTKWSTSVLFYVIDNTDVKVPITIFYKLNKKDMVVEIIAIDMDNIDKEIGEED